MYHGVQRSPMLNNIVSYDAMQYLLVLSWPDRSLPIAGLADQA